MTKPELEAHVASLEAQVQMLQKIIVEAMKAAPVYVPQPLQPLPYQPWWQPGITFCVGTDEHPQMPAHVDMH